MWSGNIFGNKLADNEKLIVITGEYKLIVLLLIMCLLVGSKLTNNGVPVAGT